jgi:hypothetical protein
LTNFTIDNCLIIAKARLSTSHIWSCPLHSFETQFGLAGQLIT